MNRVVTALFLVPIAVYSALFAPEWLFIAIVALVALLSMREYARITESLAPLG
jgi:CDP-diglyceride synthetase